MIKRLAIEIPPAAAHRFVADMQAYHAEPNGHKRDEIAARQLHVLREFQPSRAPKLRLADIKELFERMQE
jgi:hypothetical protein